MAFPCGCNEEYGPCEKHCTVLAQREGASVRTGDELQDLFITDAEAIGVTLSPWGASVRDRAHVALDRNRDPVSGTAWFGDGVLCNEVATLIDQIEADLGTMGCLVKWDDGYMIVRTTEDCPLSE